MNEKPDIVKEMRQAEKLGKLQNKTQSTFEKLEVQEESDENVSDNTIGFAEYDKDLSPPHIKTRL